VCTSADWSSIDRCQHRLFMLARGCAVGCKPST
jgi:hypothetical protein